MAYALPIPDVAPVTAAETKQHTYTVCLVNYPVVKVTCFVALIVKDKIVCRVYFE